MHEHYESKNHTFYIFLSQTTSSTHSSSSISSVGLR